MPGHVRCPSTASIDIRQRGDRRTDQAAFPPARGEDELLELGPSIGFSSDALAVRMSQGVNGDPVTSLARCTPEQLPGPLRLADEGLLQESEGEPAGLEALLAKQPIREEQQGRGAVLLRRVPEAARH